MNESILYSKSMDFSIDIVNLYKYLCSEKREYVLSKQILRSGTSIGANIREANYAQSRADFINKMSISLKESNETLYWLELLYKTNYINEDQYNKLYSSCLELLKMLQASVITSKANKK